MFAGRHGRPWVSNSAENLLSGPVWLWPLSYERYLNFPKLGAWLVCYGLIIIHNILLLGLGDLWFIILLRWLWRWLLLLPVLAVGHEKQFLLVLWTSRHCSSSVDHKPGLFLSFTLSWFPSSLAVLTMFSYRKKEPPGALWVFSSSNLSVTVIA